MPSPLRQEVAMGLKGKGPSGHRGRRVLSARLGAELGGQAEPRPGARLGVPCVPVKERG